MRVAKSSPNEDCQRTLVAIQIWKRTLIEILGYEIRSEQTVRRAVTR